MKKEINQHRKQFLALLLMAVMGVFVGCAKDPEDTPGTEKQYALAVNVIDVGYKATDGSLNGAYTTKFVNGDKIGLYVVKSDGTILNKNVCLTYDGTAWTGDALMSVAGAKYFAYYPYKEAPSGALIASATDAKAFFAELITLWTPSTDQSTLANYGASDLMVGSGNIGERVGNTYKLGFTMNHALSLVVIEMPLTKYTLASDSKYTWITGATAANFTGFKPYLSTNGTYRYLVKAAQYGATLSGSYQDTYGTVHEKTWDANIAAGTFAHSKVDGGVQAKTHTLQSGDFYMNDGSLIAKGSTLTADQQASCIGIVFQTDITRIGSGEKAALADKGIATAHGLVMALTWATSSVWGPAINEPEDPFTPTNLVKLAYRDIEGYNKTKFITDKIINGDETYGAFKAAFTYGHGGSAKYTAPASSTGWFLPSIGQCWDIFVNLGDLSILNEYRDSEIDSNIGLDAPRDITSLAFNKINSMLGKVSGSDTFSSSQTIHSSSQVSSTHTIIWSGYYYYDKLIKSTTKTSNCLIRTTLAF